MINLSFLLSIVKADFLERTRRSSFRMTLCLVLYLGYVVNAGQILIELGGYRGIYNSAWVGSLMAVVITFLLGLVGFFLVKNTIDRDERTGVGQILATTPLTRAQYLLGKWLSNLVVLTSLVGILGLAAVFMQWFQREAAQIHLWALVAPLLFIALPMMALVAALAVFFETVSWLKGGFGNLVYFGVFVCLLLVGIFLPQAPWLDVIGLNLVASNMRAAAWAALPGYDGTFVLAMISGKPLGTFLWPGLDWTAGLIAQRLLWVGVGMGIVRFGALFFNRFDPAGRAASRRKQPTQVVDGTSEEERAGNADLKSVRLTPLAKPGRFHRSFLRLVWLECLLLVKGLQWYWLAGMAALWIGCAAAPSESLRKTAFALVAIWPVLVWSRMGEQEARYQAGQLIFQAAYPLGRLLLSAWLSGVLVTAVASGGVLLGRLVHSEPIALLPWALSVLFIPTLALSLGIWSCSSKAFEVIYPILWYLGPFNPQNNLVVLDYLGIHAQSPVNATPLLVTGGIFLLMLAALVGRRRQMMMEM